MESDAPIERNAPRMLFRGRYREVTPAAITFAVVIGVLVNAAVTYAGLKIGFTIGASAVAAVPGFGVLCGDGGWARCVD